MVQNCVNAWQTFLKFLVRRDGKSPQQDDVSSAEYLKHPLDIIWQYVI